MSARTNGTNLPLLISQAELSLWFYSELLVTVIGVILNFVTFVMILRTSSLRAGSGILIMHQAFSYGAICLVDFLLNPFFVYLQFHNRLVIPSSVCLYSEAVADIFLQVPYWAMAILALNRLIAVSFPYHYPRFTTKPAVYSCIGFCWFMALVSVIPISLGWTGHFHMSASGRCSHIPNAIGVPYESFLTVAQRIVSGGSYILIGLKIIGLHIQRRRNKNVAPEKNNSRRKACQEGTMKRRMDIVKMLFASYLWFQACSLPLVVIVTYYPRIYRVPSANLWLRFLSICQFSLDPIIFYILNKEFRQGYHRLFRTWVVTVREHSGIVHPASFGRRLTVSIRHNSNFLLRSKANGRFGGRREMLRRVLASRTSAST
ncbi:hypothetical protein RvY_18032 [Ramazzottius varieornatus]|uniref:G-protein coupled receptors family 1 profile domain-containing protein n=1 Tax=Ramazzottius varieornatus TaxID=947166 RepID=A0A1D1WAI8_RAMVA|nr:hypothetical protein RvY_18032 [Ramazzottius varieornatus]